MCNNEALCTKTAHQDTLIKKSWRFSIMAAFIRINAINDPAYPPMYRTGLALFWVIFIWSGIRPKDYPI